MVGPAPWNGRNNIANRWNGLWGIQYKLFELIKLLNCLFSRLGYRGNLHQVPLGVKKVQITQELLLEQIERQQTTSYWTLRREKY